MTAPGAQQAGVEIETREFGSLPGDGSDPLAFVVSTNLHRRHLTESQRASVAARLANMRQGARTDREPRANLHEVSTSSAAEMLNVSERSVKSARKVHEVASACDARTCAPWPAGTMRRGEARCARNPVQIGLSGRGGGSGKYQGPLQGPSGIAHQP